MLSIQVMPNLTHKLLLLQYKILQEIKLLVKSCFHILVGYMKFMEFPYFATATTGLISSAYKIYLTQYVADLNMVV